MNKHTIHAMLADYARRRNEVEPLKKDRMSLELYCTLLQALDNDDFPPKLRKQLPSPLVVDDLNVWWDRLTLWLDGLGDDTERRLGSTMVIDSES